MCSLVQKYNIPGPRYTSYPTVPYWDMNSFSGKKWEETLQKSFSASNATEGISLYIHLPFCESMCTFCGCHKRITKRNDVQIPYIQTVLKEWELYCKLFDEKPVVKELHLGGGTPTFFSPENLKYLINGILKTAVKANNHEFSFEGHPNNTTKEHLQALYDVGFRRVSYGVQDYNEKVQKAIHRIQPFENVKNVTDIAREIGYTSIGHDIIFGLPHQTLEDVEATILKTKSLKPDRLAFYSYAHVPWIKGNGQRGYNEADLPSADEKREQYENGKKLLAEVGYKEIGMDHFASKTDSLYKALDNKKLHRNFMGYTASKTQLMIGLGASSISDSWYSFAQNVKSIEEYQHLVENNIIPIYRGHILSDEDKIIRQHILDLMCHFKTEIKVNEASFFNANLVLKKLKEMEADQLIEINNNIIQVTKKGMPFIRNICMAFDMHLHRKAPETRLFSMTI
ncbi:oxygen-independent coproporphyrinogen III oxidase [Cellulophaga baltica]|uniref:oxygen-independent coproporphyrinogen III oxidase n=1 Tax=Cellulophaga TaxID=104264 RepID=UPI001C0708C7|nr:MULTISPECIES: oxygen-independent coproporphyrinogen III oxidase [Cellulophaga]MBU2995264.1 oxygen-independent coproporphyrinogen III oxidase [Cellulophaga baltica]MDO6766659.1 oxygen-independent coproporphyrinogen III oxidase [Cellulophaga sp. 1_MG-2023]